MKGQQPERGRSQGRGVRHERSAAKRASILDGGPSGGYKRQHRLQRGAPLYCVKDVGELTRRVLLLSRLVSDGFGGSGGVWRCLLWPSRTPWHDGCTVTTELQKGSMFTTAAPMDAASVRCHICASRTCQNEWANCLSTYTCRRRLPAQL